MKFKKLTKKSQIIGKEALSYVILGIFLAITILFIAYFLPKSNAEISKIPEGLEDYLLAQRFFSSKSCFTYLEGRRLYPSIIDINKFNQATLDSCYSESDSGIKAFRLTLDYNNEKKVLSTKNWQGFLKRASTETIFVYDNDKIYEGKILIEIQDAIQKI